MELEARERPLVIFDGNCGFCRIWIEYWRALTNSRVDYVPSQEAAANHPEIPAEEFTKSVQLILPDRRVLSGAHAVFQLLSYTAGTWPLHLYASMPGFRAASECAYRFVASHRSFFYWLTVLFFGKHIRHASSQKIEWLFLRLLALVYLAAFLSLGPQVRGLIGARGILPIGGYLDAVRQALGADAWRIVPTLLWLGHSDAVLSGLCIAGAILAVVLLIGFFERICLILLYVLYLSLVSAGQDFLSFQWDMLLLEAGFLAIFLGSSRVVVWLFRILVFRLMFSSGAVKLLSGDPAWRNLSAMSYHYFTQPLPAPVAWYFQQLPSWFHKLSTASVFAIELGIPFLIFLPRRARCFGAWCLIGLQMLILITGNYAFFNWLSIGLCIFLFDDAAVSRWIPTRQVSATPRKLAIAVAILVLGLGSLQMIATFGRLPRIGYELVQAAQPFGIVNTYGLFAVMTTTRPEIAIQGSNDGANWSDYIFKYKSGPLDRRPLWVAPYQPRLDWQMWFAALGSYRENPWFVNFMVRLLEGSPDVLLLLERNPFPNAPPRYVRALASTYRFTNWSERRATGNWWKAEPAGVYLRAISLQDVRR
jgi:predicted DCC family thiol-disulfide oxidoreductase YuxK